MHINNDIDYLKYLKKKENIIFGAGEQGRQGYYRLQKEGIKIIAFCDNDKEKQEQLFCDEKVLSFKEICEINNENIMIIICSNYEREIKEQLLDHKIYNYISISQIDFGGGSGYYDERYFMWQKSIGEFGGKINAKRFKPYIKSDMVVVEFGSGGGYLLDNLLAREKIGSENNNYIYTWNCLNLGNLFEAAGYFVQSVENVKSMWPKHYFEIEKEISEQFLRLFVILKENVSIIIVA